MRSRPTGQGRAVRGLALCACLVACANDHGTGPDERGWDLVFADEFDGVGIDSSRWTWEVSALGGGNNELQYYTARDTNALVAGGYLVIRALKEGYTDAGETREYTSARITSAAKADWTYGRFEVRAKMPRGQGLWPAIWMLPAVATYGGWAASGEIDIVEMLGDDTSTVYGTLHYGGEWPRNENSGQRYTIGEGDFASEFHVFRLDWAPDRFTWYVDGNAYQSQTTWHTSGGSFPAPFDHSFHLVMNVAVGGNWPGDPDETTTFPQEMVVDYVRVYQRAE
ncbi:MAG: glycoside hydrolase family 16 protein [Candidatus Latescibacterota bacterium]